MSLQKLQILSNHKFSEQIIKKLQFWLQNQPKNTWLFLNPLQFSVDNNISTEQSINLFLECTLNKDAQIFRVKSIYLCPNCDEHWETAFDTIEKNLEINLCPNCGLAIDRTISRESQNIYFELTVDIFPDGSTYYSKAEEIIKCSPMKLNQLEEVAGATALKKLRRC